jgi:hypothetical protein
MPAHACSPGVLARCSAYTQYSRSPQPPVGSGLRPSASTSVCGGITLESRIRLKFATPAARSAASNAASAVAPDPTPVTSGMVGRLGVAIDAPN